MKTVRRVPDLGRYRPDVLEAKWVLISDTVARRCPLCPDDSTKESPLLNANPFSTTGGAPNQAVADDLDIAVEALIRWDSRSVRVKHLPSE